MKYKEIKEKTEHLTQVSAVRIYGEILILGAVACSSFLAAVAYQNLYFLIVAGFFMYRGLSLIHEVSHLSRTFKYYELSYNIFFGYFNRVAAYTIKTHRFHHSLTTFGTARDPEYEKWTDKSPLLLLRPAILSFIYPLLLTLRFGVWPLFSIFFPRRYEAYTHRRLSSFVMNLKFDRPPSAEDEKLIRRDDLIMSGYLVTSLSLAFYFDRLPTFIAYWYTMGVVLFLLNTYRALVAHRYLMEVSEVPVKLENQLEDSVTIEGNWFTEVWAPNGLRYHSTHHYLPQIPYYNLGKAHSLLKQTLPKDHPYFATLEPNFSMAFKKLFSSCKAG